MKIFSVALSIITILFLFTSCADNDDNPSKLVGTWELTSWSINIPFDVNVDTVESLNLLEEISCANNETLVFKTDGTLYSNDSFNHNIKITLLNETTNMYRVNVECNEEGTISFATTFRQSTDTMVSYNDIESTIIDNNQLISVYKDAVNIYNEDMTEVIATKDLTLVHTKL